MPGGRKKAPTPQAKDFAAAVVERMPALLVDVRGRIIAVAPAAVPALGLRPEAWIGQRLDDMLPRLGGEKRGSRIAGDGPIERRLGAANDPAARIFQAIDVPLGDGDHWVLLIDRSEQHRLRAECLHLGQLASAGRLISSIVHEINNPLSGILGYVQLLLLQEHDRDTRVMLERIQSESVRSSRIVRNLLDFARRRDADTLATDLPSVVRKALELKAHELRVHNVAVQLELPRALPLVNADPHRLLQVFVNLVANAEQAMYESDRGGRLVIEAIANRSDVVVRVRDTGPGVPEKHRERIFDAFFTTKAEGKGTGLGLGLCREILHRAGGSLHLCETGETGACFELRLAIAASGAPAEKQPRKRRPARVTGRRILVVEDDPVCRAFLAEAFESTANEVHPFDRSEAALKFLRSRWVDVVVSDLHRPGTNGLEFHAEVKKLDEQLAQRMVFLTGDTMNQDLARHLSQSGTVALAKPVELDDLHAAVARVLARPPRRQRTLFGGEEA